MVKNVDIVKIKNNRLQLIVIAVYFVITTIFMVCLFPAPALAANGQVPVELQAKLFLTALTYEKNLKNDVTEPLTIGLLYFPGTLGSEQEAKDFAKVLEQFKDKKVSGRSLRTVLLGYQDAENLKNRISYNHINVLYVSSGIKDLIKEATRVTQSEKVLSFTGTASYVSECGISMAVGLKENKPKIYLNLSATKAEGADFSAKLLRVVKIVD